MILPFSVDTTKIRLYELHRNVIFIMKLPTGTETLKNQILFNKMSLTKNKIYFV